MIAPAGADRGAVARRPRYEALVRGGVLECVVGLGFDDAVDGGPHPAGTGPATGGPAPHARGTAGRALALVHALRDRGYAEGAAAAAALLAERDPPPRDGCHELWLSHPRALARGGGVVVRVVANRDGTAGVAAAASFVDGLARTAVCIYAGHGRHGLGLDFDPALAVEVAPGGDLPAEPERLARCAAAEARRRGEPIAATLDRWLAGGRLRVRGQAGRVLLARPDPSSGNRLSRLIHWAAARAGDAAHAAGPGGASPAPPHRLWFLICCGGERLIDAIRTSPGHGRAALRLVGFHAPPGPAELARIPWLIDALAAGGAWPELITVLGGDAARRGGPAGVLVDGAGEDPPA